MKSKWRFGALAALLAAFVVLAGPAGLRDVPVAEAADGNNLTVRIADGTGGTNHQVLIVNPCGPDSAALDNGEAETFGCATGGVWSIQINPQGNRQVGSIGCLGADLNVGPPGDGVTASQQSDVTDLTGGVNENDLYTVTITDNEDFDCLFTLVLSEGDTDGDGGLNPDAGNPLDPDGDGIIVMVAIAVTAEPNVIPCGGTAQLTATARAVDTGLVVPSELLGFHWETNVGQLNVGPPNTAEAMDNYATLTLVPGMTSATVRAWVGDLSQNPGVVTVQQFCPGVGLDNDQSIAPGAITLSASSNAATCGETIFIGARVRDSKNQVVPNDTVVSFLASAGEFQTGAGVQTSYTGNAEDTNANSSLNTVSQYNAATVNGVLNLVYIAPALNGEAVITAAAGDKFAKMNIKVTCAIAATAASTGGGGGGGGGTAAPSCTPIGDGICIPNTNGATRIRPPSTGDAGLK